MGNLFNEYAKPSPPNDFDTWLTMRELAGIWGVSKATVRNYINDKTKPLPYKRNADGIIFIREIDADDYVRFFPDRGPNCQRGTVYDKVPVEPDAPVGVYYTLTEAAATIGYSNSALRSWTKRTHDPLRSFRNKDNVILIYRTDLFVYADKQTNPDAFAPAKPSPADEELGCFYPELEAFTGTYMTLQQVADALHVRYETVRCWIHNQEHALPHLRLGRKIHVNKYRLMRYLTENEEQGQVA